jgi:hypothetical protein
MEKPITYIYDNGFSKRRYICCKCSSRNLVMRHVGGFSPCVYDCADCKEVNYAPKWENVLDLICMN